MKPEIIVVCGPTGIGKTSTTIKLSKKFGGQIINADSMQIYRFMDIGTAKPTPEERAKITHFMVDVVDPDEPFDAARFAERADIKIRELSDKGVVPFVAGGTGLYIKALINGLFRSIPADPEILKKLNEEVIKIGSHGLHQKLSKYDQDAAEKIHPNDSFRVIRALEIYYATGRPISEYHKKHSFSESPYNVLKIGLSMERERLYDRINRRVDLMLEEGLLNEVELLIKKGYSTSLKSMRSLGYRHMVEYINGDVSWEEAVRTLKRDTRRYAKRQLTWFRADTEIMWVEPEKIESIYPHVDGFLTTGKNQ